MLIRLEHRAQGEHADTAPFPKPPHLFAQQQRQQPQHAPNPFNHRWLAPSFGNPSLGGDYHGILPDDHGGHPCRVGVYFRGYPCGGQQAARSARACLTVPRLLRKQNFPQERHRLSYFVSLSRQRVAVCQCAALSDAGDDGWASLRRYRLPNKILDCYRIAYLFTVD